MIILQDSREQNPLEFNHPYITKVEIRKLDIGDYNCQFTDGYIPPVYFERKSLADLFQTFGQDYSRFKKEILRAKELNYTIVIIIEGSFTRILKGYERSMVEGISILRKLFTLWIKYGIHFVCCKNREEMAEYIAEFYSAWGRNYLEKQMRDF